MQRLNECVQQETNEVKNHVEYANLIIIDRETYIQCVFEHKGARYRFTRKIEPDEYEEAISGFLQECNERIDRIINETETDAQK